MRRRFLDFCLLAYPRAQRRDRDYLRDLALDLAERQGLGRQAFSLLHCGLRKRVTECRRRPGRAVAASLFAMALALALGGAVLSAPAQGRREVDQFACRVNVGAAANCAQGWRRLTAHERTGWDCTAAGLARPVSSNWKCTRAS